MNARLLLVSHASTAAQRAGRFPADTADDPLDARGRAEAEAARTRLTLPQDATVIASPAVCARETAEALGLVATVDNELADMNYGTWHGERLHHIAAQSPEALAAWTRDPYVAPHGGESFSQLVMRIGAWLDASSRVAASNDNTSSTNPPHAPQIIVITHATVIRAAIVHALSASPAVFSHIEIAPLCVIELRHSSRGWTWWPGSI